jgi:hypothetical protein
MVAEGGAYSISAPQVGIVAAIINTPASVKLCCPWSLLRSPGLHVLLQVPRLTAVLRALATDHGARFDADAAFIQRQKALQQRQQLQLQQGRGGSTGGTAGQSQLAQKLIGDWSKGVCRYILRSCALCTSHEMQQYELTHLQCTPMHTNAHHCTVCLSLQQTPADG